LRQTAKSSKRRGGEEKRLTGEKNEIVFRTLELPLDVEPSAVTAKLNGAVLGICFPKVHVKAAGQSGLGIAKTKPLALTASALHMAQLDL
jgi:HSP20 family molecular chaperone IbpA